MKYIDYEIKPTDLLLYELVRSGLAISHIAPNHFTAVTKDMWEEILLQAIRQSVIGVAFEGVLALPKELQPERLILLKWHSMTEQVKQNHFRMEQTLVQIKRWYAQKNISWTLIKGLGLSTYYPKPELRQTGDIDTYIAEGYAAIQEITKEMKGGYENHKHACFIYNKFWIENHTSFSEIRTSSLRKIADRYLLKQIEKQEELTILGEKITVASADFNALHMLLHAANHFLVIGLGLRHLCDWALFLKTQKGNYDSVSLKNILHEIGLDYFASAFTWAAIKYLSLPKEYMPFPMEETGNEQVLMKILMEGGNFGHYSNTQRKSSQNKLISNIYGGLFLLKREKDISIFWPKEMKHYSFKLLMTFISRIIHR